MALTATATQGFEPTGLTSGEEIFYLPGDPGVTFTRGDMVKMSNGVLAAHTKAATPIGTVVETTVCPGATQAFAKGNELNKIMNDAEDKCLVPVKLLVPGGLPIFLVTFAGQLDGTAAAYTVGTRSVQLGAATGANDDCNSALMYMYEGPCAGEVNIVEDTVQATPEVITHRVWAGTPTTSSKYIVLEGEGGGVGGMGFFSRINCEDLNNLTTTDGYDDGEFIIFMDWLSAPTHLQNLRLPVIRALSSGLA